MFHLFRDIVDVKNALPLSRLGAVHLKAYWTAMLGMPANRSKSKEFRDIPLAEIIRRASADTIPPEKRIEAGTLRNHFQQIKTFINWACMNEYHTNPKIADILEIKQERRADERRDPYTTEELSWLFSPDVFRRGGVTMREHPHDAYAYRFWVPLLGLFTGARLEEICQLHARDIIAIDDKGQQQPIFITTAGNSDAWRQRVRTAKEKKRLRWQS